jgi:hypothetical protein
MTLLRNGFAKARRRLRCRWQGRWEAEMILKNFTAVDRARRNLP